jgi:hypothetical protein
MKETFLLWMLLVAGVMIAVAILGYYQAKRRREMLAAWAAARGWGFTADRDGGFEDRYGGFDCLRKGSNRYAYNISEGTLNGRPAWAFDYHYETYSSSKHGRKTHHHHFSAVIIASGMLLKPLFIRPETFLDKVTEFIGYDDIDFESAEFSRKFYVKSPDKKWAYDVIGQPTMELLLAAPRFTLHFAGAGIIACRGQTFEVPDFDAALNLVEGILERLPPSLLRELQPGRSNA